MGSPRIPGLSIHLLTTPLTHCKLALRGWTCYVSFHWANWRHTDWPFLSIYDKRRAENTPSISDS